MIEFKDVSKSYGKNDVLVNFNLQIEDGKICCILGESGVGKTTLLNALAGVIKYEGEITRVRCSYIFQEPRLVPNLTVKKNLMLVTKDENKVDRILSLVGLFDKKDSYPVTLSGGQARRVDFARAFVYDSDVLLLDEPFSSLDLKLKIEMMNLFSELQKESRKPAVFVTHDIDEATLLSHRICILKDGHITLDISLDGEPLREYGEAEDVRKKIIEELMK